MHLACFYKFSFSLSIHPVTNTVGLRSSQICICEFTYLLNCACSPPGFNAALARALLGMHRAQELESPWSWVPTWVTESSSTLPSCFSSHCEQVSFCVVCSVPHSSQFCAFCWRFRCLSWSLSTALDCCPKARVMCSVEEIPVLDALCSGMSYSAVGCEFNMNGSTGCVKMRCF